MLVPDTKTHTPPPPQKKKKKKEIKNEIVKMLHSKYPV